MIKKALLIVIVLGIIGIVALSARAPKEFVLKTARIDEASGIVRSILNEGILWTHNDSGGEASLYAIDTQGNLIATLQLPGIKNRDWEDIAIYKEPKSGESYLYVGEIGDNSARYPSVFVYKVPEPLFTDADSIYTAQSVEKIEITYEDGARDAEALFIDPHNADIYIISKREEQVGLYRVQAPDSKKPNKAVKTATLPLSWVTAADISPDGKKLLVKTYTSIWQYKLKRDKSGMVVTEGKPKTLPYRVEPQGEAICFDKKGKTYYTLSEAGLDSPQVLYYYK